MSSVFSLAQESAEYDEALTNHRDGEPVDSLGDPEAMQEILTEAHTEGNRFDDLSDGQDKVHELRDEVESVLESGGLSPKGLQYLQLSLRNIVGKRYAARQLPSMESAEREDPRLVTRIALEGMVETIKQFWLAIKNQLGKFWNQTKAWYIKTFDVANKIIARSKALAEKANTMTSSPAEKSFTMGGASLISVNYQVKDPAICIKGLETLKTIMDTILINVGKQNQSTKADQILDSASKFTHAYRSNVNQNEANLPRIYTESNLGNALKGAFLDDAPKYETLATVANDPEMAKRLGIDTTTTIYAMSQPLPGNKSFFVVQPNTTIDPNITPSTAEAAIELADKIKLHRWLLSDTSAKPKTMDDEMDVKTLMSAQVDQIAGLCGEMGETILKYKKEFEARDKYIQRVVKGFDTIFKELEDETNLDHSKGGADTNRAQVSGMSANNASDKAASKQQQADATASGDAGKVAAADANKQQTNEKLKAGNVAIDTFNSATDKDGADVTSAIADKQASSSTSQVDKTIKKLAQSIMGLFKKNMTISGSVVTHAVHTCGAFLTYGEKSAVQYGGS